MRERALEKEHESERGERRKSGRNGRWREEGQSINSYIQRERERARGGTRTHNNQGVKREKDETDSECVSVGP